MHMASNALKEVERLTEPSAGKCKKFLEKRAHALETVSALKARRGVARSIGCRVHGEVQVASEPRVLAGRADVQRGQREREHRAGPGADAEHLSVGEENHGAPGAGKEDVEETFVV